MAIMETNPSKEGESSHEISVSCEGSADDADPLELRRAAIFTLEQHDCHSGSLSITVVDEPKMIELNARYKGAEGSTDVLAFDLSDDPERGLDGEIVVCRDVAERESRRRGLTLGSELQLYVIHGVLHLLGYDDRDEQDAARMHAREDELLTALGVGPVYGVPEC